MVAPVTVVGFEEASMVTSFFSACEAHRTRGPSQLVALDTWWLQSQLVNS